MSLIHNAKHKVVKMIKGLEIQISRMRVKETVQVRAMIQVSNKKRMVKKMGQEVILSNPMIMIKNKAVALNQKQINNS